MTLDEFRNLPKEEQQAAAQKILQSFAESRGLDLADALSQIDDKAGMKGAIAFEAYDAEGNRKWTEEVDPNLVTDEGLNYLLSAALNGGAASSTWYVGLVDGGSPNFNSGDTLSSHGGWTENQDYSEGSRPTWQSGSVSGQSVDNSSSRATFSIDAPTSIAGAFLADDATKGGTSGTLFAEGSFGSTRSLQSGDTLNVTYTISAS